MAFRALIAGLALFAGAMSANASLSTLDSSFGQDTLITDSMTGLTWLKLDETAGMSYEAVLAQTGSGGTFADFDIATSAQLRTLTFDAGVDFSLDLGNSTIYAQPGPIGATVCAQCVAAGSAFGSLFVSQAVTSTLFGADTAPDQYLAWGMVYNTPGGPNQTELHTYMGISGTSSRMSFQDDGVIQSVGITSLPWVGTWLVTTLPPIPEPSTYALLLVGLATVGVATRRRKARRA